MQNYPATLKQDDNGTLLVTFPDFPEAVTYGGDQDSALAEASNSLIAAISARMDDGEDIPAPSKLKSGQTAVTLPPLVAVKAAIYMEMSRQHVSKSELARRLEQNPKQVDRLLEVTHSSRHDQLDKALAALGKRLEVTVSDAA
ncbi:MAG: type II toxin-antitoxin system HicB family antitoxin [Dehalococcoidia bacterium]|jgi:antitoxin HicB|nr:type II toxin-antitoxin system HicB family antitoxin [Dehalococcoidia bacterium]